MTTDAFEGMTVSERLFVAGLMDEFDRAAQARDRQEMANILRRVALGDQAGELVNMILANPEKYGF